MTKTNSLIYHFIRIKFPLTKNSLTQIGMSCMYIFLKEYEHVAMLSCLYFEQLPHLKLPNETSFGLVVFIQLLSLEFCSSSICLFNE